MMNGFAQYLNFVKFNNRRPVIRVRYGQSERGQYRFGRKDKFAACLFQRFDYLQNTRVSQP
jgi:hypothetical protein